MATFIISAVEVQTIPRWRPCRSWPLKQPKSRGMMWCCGCGTKLLR